LCHQAKYKKTIIVKSEATRAGVRRGAVNFVVAPEPLEGNGCKHQKTDRLDTWGVLNQLNTCLEGGRDATAFFALILLFKMQQKSAIFSSRPD
jgi:hypothetical protein